MVGQSFQAVIITPRSRKHENVALKGATFYYQDNINFFLFQEPLKSGKSLFTIRSLGIGKFKLQGYFSMTSESLSDINQTLFEKGLIIAC